MEKECYTQADVDLTLARVAAGEKKTAIARTLPRPITTRSKTVLPPELEQDLVDWIAAMRCCGMPGGRKDIIAKSSTMLAVAAGRSVPTRNTPMRILTGGWYQRFPQHHPSLSNRIAQCIARVRSAVDGESISILFNTLAKLFIEMKIDGTRIFNMDETSFMPKTARRKVVAVRGSLNVWRKETKPNFHMTVVGAVSGAGAAISPLFIVAGVRRFKKDIAALSIKGSAITGAPKGNVAHLKKPVVLILDNSSMYIDAEAAETCVEYGIILVALPENATHLFQPLDVALFKPFKDCVQDLMLARLCSINDHVARKTTAIEMTCTAYRRALIDKPTSAINGFRECGIWPFSLVELRAR
ncbi:hypothetical protein JG687_00016430 [Phytophthora cactorum]|uniref:HTH CENPB-type domain-containing protein n=1 Tax=Phytophthora cactorum TaxID=29920 RepID=A0A8T1TTA1_9STRA|nr:hypothetical protein JG687_00016430 [Phytophthora cactorum]